MNLRIAAPACLLVIAAAARAAEPMPTSEDLQALADAKKWPELIKAVNRVLPLKGDLAKPYDRVDLWTKRAEAQLRLNQFASASQSVAKIADEKTATPDQKDKALALSALFKKTDAKGYRTPAKLGSVKTYNVLDEKGRDDALKALFDAGSAETKAAIDRTKLATQAKPLVALAKDVNELKPLDRVVNKSGEKTDEMEKTIAGNFLAATKNWIGPVKMRLNELQRQGDERIENRYTDDLGRIRTTSYRRGNTEQEVGEVRKYLDQMRVIADTFHALQGVMGEAGQSDVKAVEGAVQPSYEVGETIVRKANNRV